MHTEGEPQPLRVRPRSQHPLQHPCSQGCSPEHLTWVARVHTEGEPQPLRVRPRSQHPLQHPCSQGCSPEHLTWVARVQRLYQNEHNEAQRSARELTRVQAQVSGLEASLRQVQDTHSATKSAADTHNLRVRTSYRSCVHADDSAGLLWWDLACVGKVGSINRTLHPARSGSLGGCDGRGWPVTAS